ncbi:TlpA disulfide reductase family protein [Persicobacter psychrovividus]|uniref:Thiol:disulfide interchange protein n=1 Tax=Persicobacter psychrovividus TaxID=387638 RepID=A0ABM7VHF9_9BACT|nr:thiol:disulfide interchange protein [Persicobacter psychrovividus]
MGIKKWAPFLGLGMMAFACNNADNATTVLQGKLTGEKVENVDSVYLLKRGESSYIREAASAVKDGAFAIKEANLANGSYYIQAPTDGTFGTRKPTVMMFYKKGDVVTADINLDAFADAKITGNEGSEQAVYSAFQNGEEEFQTKMRAMGEEYRRISSEAKDGKLTAEQEAQLKKIETDYEALNKQYSDYTMSFIKEHNTSIVSADLLAQQAPGLKTEQLKSGLDLLQGAATETEVYQRMTERYNTLNATAEGQPVLNFTMQTPEGKEFSTEALQGKVFMIDFWASWCGPCRKENPNVVKMYNEYHKQGFEIVGVSLDNKKENWEKAITKDKLTWHHVSDLKGWKNEVAQKYGINSIPATVLVDASGKIVARNLRGEELEAKVKELMAAK